VSAVRGQPIAERGITCPGVTAGPRGAEGAGGA